MTEIQWSLSETSMGLPLLPPDRHPLGTAEKKSTKLANRSNRIGGIALMD